ncbi:formate dehydrogenase accessory sulfurtransferase FdhD [Methylobacter sp.]|uniref:formate dehydrogenase accessory sulfurtransferase FdhD n=1 Tax=Methylobacter sp. TaxID=2051955 RepID=UPI002FDED09C
MPNAETSSDSGLDFVAELGWANYRQHWVNRWQGCQHSEEQDYVAEEVPIVLVYNGISHVVMLATPTNLEDFALGFSMTEGIIQSAQEFLSARVYQRANGIEVNIKIPEQRFACLTDKGRNLTGRTGCGLCGASTLKQAIRQPPPVYSTVSVTAEQLTAALADLHSKQSLNQLTGAIHAAAWIEPERGIVDVREDVGRHNALDKLLGLLCRTGKDVNTGFIIVTSRASYEMVQKTAFMGIGLLVAISAPTGLAIRLAEQTGLTLIGFARHDKHVVYAHPQRLTH